MGANPEVIRNARAHLRGDRMIAAAAICAVLSLAAAFAEYYRYQNAADTRWGAELLGLAIWAQGLVLVLGGGLAALQSIQREKELNTFDFQRATRLTPLELTVGKLLGVPVFTYFIALCLMPAAVVGAVAAHARLEFVLAAYAVLLLGAITVHALALLASLFVERGIATGGVILIALSLWSGPAFVARFALNLNSLSPFVAAQIAAQTSWAVTRPSDADAYIFWRPSLTDVFFGRPVHHVPVLIVLYLVFTAWFVLVVARNIKRDPAVYEALTPAAALGMALWINLVALAFFRWSGFAPLNAHTAFLGLNVVLFYVLGLGMLRNRDRTRRLRTASAGARRWAPALWPAPYVIPGSLLAGLLPLPFLYWAGRADAQWDLGLAVFRAALITAWVGRDLLYLQWMNLQPGARPLRRGVLYLVVFYVCAATVLATLRPWAFGDPVGRTVSAALIPGLALSLEPSRWAAESTLWLVVLGTQVALAGLFASLHHAKLADLESAAVREAAA